MGIRKCGRMTCLALLLLASVAGAADLGSVFPTFKGKDLTGRSVMTDQFRGKAWLIVVGFDRAHAKPMEAWAKQFKQAFPNEAQADYFEIAALPGALTLMRGFIDRNMVKGTPEVARTRIMTVYAADSLCGKLRIKDRKLVYAYVLDHDGKIAHQEIGEPSSESIGRVRQQVARLIAVSNAGG